jgi:hypothetical protein
MNPTTQKMVSSGQWLETDQLTEIQATATEAWDDAERSGSWKIEVDVADLTKLCNELVARRQDEA